MSWSTKLIKQWEEDPKAVERDMKILDLLGEGDELVIPYTEVSLFEQSYKLRNKGVVLLHTDEELLEIIHNKTSPESMHGVYGKPYEHQVEMLKFIQSNKMSVLCTARQIGTTSALATYVTHYLANNWEKSIMFMTKDVEGATNKILKSLENCPYHRQSGIVDYDLHSEKVNVEISKDVLEQSSAAVIRFENGCTLRIFDMTKLLVSPDLLIVDGIQHFGKELYEGLLPGLFARTGSKVAITGLPDRDGKFADVLEWANDNNKVEVKRWDWTCHWFELAQDIKSMLTTEEWLMEYELLVPGTQEWRDKMLETILR